MYLDLSLIRMKTLVLVAMSDEMQMATEVAQAVTANVADADIAGFTPQDDGSLTVTLRINMPEDQDTCKAPDMGDTDATKDDKNPEGEGSDEDTDATPDTDCTGDEGGSDDDTPSGWEINGKLMGFNDLQKAVSAADVPYPSGAGGDKLAETLRQAANPPETDDEGGSENDTNDEHNESDTNDENEWPSAKYLKNHGVKAKNVNAVQEKANEGCDRCNHKDCEYAANGDEASFCASHQNDEQKGNKSGKNGDNSGSSKSETDSTADRVKKVMNHFDVKNSVAQQAVNAVEDGFAESELAYLEAQE